MRKRATLIAGAAGIAMLGAVGAAAPVQAADFLGAPLWESYPGQYSHYYYGPDYRPRPSYRYRYDDGRYHDRRYQYQYRYEDSSRSYYDPRTGRYYRRY